MTQVSDIEDIEYLLIVEDEPIPLQHPMTVGRHLDNDVLLAGEDVLDYHLRIELTLRGPRAIPLGAASLRVNGVDLAQPTGLMPGDVLEIGQHQLSLETRAVGAPAAERWHLRASEGGEARTIGAACHIGRGDDNDLQLHDGHVSRHHASLTPHAGVIWLRDLGSANGSYVNGERVSGACRLFHGDEVRFDTVRFQLVGEGADLTPVRQATAPAPQPLPREVGVPVDEPADLETTEIAAVAAAPWLEPPCVASAAASAAATASATAGAAAGAYLLGASEPVTGMTFRVAAGRTLIGRQHDCDLILGDPTVSSQHADLMVRSDGVTITNLLSTNGTRVNGDAVQTARLHDGDVLRLGRVSLVFKEVPSSGDGRPWLRRLQLALLLGSLLLALGLVVFLL